MPSAKPIVFFGEIMLRLSPPNRELLLQSAKLDVWVAGVSDSPKPPPARVTLTLATLAHAREIWIVAFGSSKAAAIADARRNPASMLPVAIVARSGPQVRWILDSEADG